MSNDNNYNFETVKDNSFVNFYEEIFKCINEEYIYCHYIGYFPSVKKLYYSIFNKEKTESMNFYYKNNRLLYKCFSSGNQGNCFNLIGYIYNLSYFETIKKVYNELVLKNKPSKNQIELREKSIGFSKSNKLEIQYCDIKVVLRGIEQYDLDYWVQYNIDKIILNLFDVKGIQECYLNNYFFWSSTSKKPLYRYLINGKYKIYSPLSTKKGKWFGNTTNHHILGLKQLDYNKSIVFITSSYKDVMCLYSIGYTSICNANSETCYIDKKVILYLKTKFENVILFLDSDESGKKASIKFSELYKIPYIITDKSIGKDPSDCVKEKGIQYLKNYLTIKLKEYEK